MVPKVGDTVYFDECPDYMWDSKNPCGTVTAIYAETGDVQVKTTKGHRMRFEEDSSWSVCGKYKREPWGFDPKYGVQPEDPNMAIDRYGDDDYDDVDYGEHSMVDFDQLGL